ncbi:MAG: CoA transferase [Chloroflexi bacterium]|nr:CoA transferase [Chloroflexota bacterium]
MTQALEGLKILDLSRMIGPFCSMFFSDMGADVIKIEEAQLRWLRAAPSGEEKARVFRHVERNKRSIALNLKTKEAQEIFYKLAGTADVVLEDFRPGVTDRLGIGYETLSRINPRIIYCAISGYGQDGPYRLLPGHDPCYLSVAGLMSITGTPDGQFVLPGAPIGDFGGGSMQAAIGILIALQARERTGRGQFVDISMTDGIVAWLAARHGQYYFGEGLTPKMGERISHVYRCQDGKYITLAPAEPWFWERLCKAVGREDFIPYKLASLPSMEPENPKKDEILAYLKYIFLTKTRDEWFKILWDADTCVGPVNSFDEAFQDPQILHRKMIVGTEHPKFGKVRQPGISIKLSDTPGEIKSLPPQRGQHTEEILLGLGYSKEQVNKMREQGIVM